MLAYEKELLGLLYHRPSAGCLRRPFRQPKKCPASPRRCRSRTFHRAPVGHDWDGGEKFTKKDGRPFAVITLEDFTGQIELMAWDEVYTKNAALLVPAWLLPFPRAHPPGRGGAGCCELGGCAQAESSARPVRLKLLAGSFPSPIFPIFSEAVKRHPGKRPLPSNLLTIRAVPWFSKRAKTLR